MQDYLVRGTAEGFRAFTAITTNLTDEARRRHDCFPVASAALGRTMTAAILLAADLKTEESVTIRITGSGPLQEIIADARAGGKVRGYVKNPRVDLPLKGIKLDVGTAVGKGHVYVTRFTGLKQPFTGSTALVSGEIAEDITNYLLVSEQTPSSVSLGVLVEPDMSVSAAGGFMVQALPGADKRALDIVEKNISVMPPVSHMIKDGTSAHDMMNLIFAGLAKTVYEPMELRFHCPCSRERVSNMLISLGREELSDMAAEGRAEVCCHFCGKKYNFTRTDLEGLLQSGF
jgi:molecular chaperone Hsp33